MTGPNPDAELDEALGIPELPPVALTADHLARAAKMLDQLEEARRPSTLAEERDGRPLLNTRQTLVLAQGIADAEQRGAARVLAEHAAAGGATP